MGCAGNREPARNLAVRSAYLDALERSDQGVEILACVVGSEGRAHRRFEAEAAQNRLRAVVPRAHRDPLLIEQSSDFFRLLTVEHEREYTGFFDRSADQGEPRHFE